MNFIFVLIFLMFSSPSFAQRYPPGGGITPNSCTSGQFAEAIDASGILTCSTPSGGGGSPGGSNEDLQYNNSGAFGGSDALTWDGTIFNANGVNIDGSQSGDPTPEMYTADWALNGDGSATFGNNGSPPIVQWDSAGNITVTSLTTMLFPGNAVTLQGGAAVAWTDGASVGTEGGGDLSLFAPGSIALNANTTISGNLSSGSDWFINNDGSFSFAQGEFAGDGSSNITNQGTYTQGNLFIDSSGNTTISGSSTLTVQEYLLPTGGVISDGGSGTIEITAPTTFINGDLVGSTWSITSSDGHVEFDGGLVSTSGTGALTASSFNGGSFNGDGSGLSDIPLSALNATVSGSTTELATVNGSLTSGHTVLIDSNGNLVDAGIAPIANPMTTLGDIIYENSTPAPARLAGNTSATLAVLTQTGTGSVSAPPAWTSTTGTGNIVRATSPTLVTPALGTPSALVGTNISGTGSSFTAGNINATSNSTLTTLSALSLPLSQTTGVATLAQGGTNNGSLPATAGGVVYTDGTKLQNTGNGTSGQLLYSNGSSAPSWANAVSPYTNPVAYTPTFGAFGTPTSVNFVWSRMGHYLYVQGTFAPSAGPASTATLSLPAGLSMDNSIASYTVVGTFAGNANSITGNSYTGNVLATPSGTVVNFAPLYVITQSSLSPSTGSEVWAGSGVQMSIQFMVPISGWSVGPAYGFTAPTVQTFTSGSGTYTTPAGVLYLKVTMAGGGGGGGGSTGNGGAGGNTTFGTTFLTANGGTGGGTGASAAGTGGVGGSATGNSKGVAVSGGQGESAGPGLVSFGPNGGDGGSNALGGGGAGSQQSTNNGSAGATNTGGGGGGSGGATAVVNAGGGGGAGAYINTIVTAPNSTYAYAVGAAGTAGTSNASYLAFAGGSGIIIVEEFYQ